MADGIKHLPKFEEGERIVLGYLLNNPDTISDISKALPASSFANTKNRGIYEIIIDHGHEDIMLVVKEVEESLGDPDIIVHLEEFVREVINANDDNFDIKNYIDRLNDVRRRRTGILLMRKAEDTMLNGEQDMYSIVSEVVTKLSDDDFNPDYLIKPIDYEERRKAGLENRRLKGYVPSGYPSLDKLLTEGFSGGTTSVIAGRPAMGKSTFKRNIIVRLCDRGLGVLNLVPEMGFDREQDGIDAIRTGREVRDFFRIKNWDNIFNQDVKASSDYIAKRWNYVVQEDPFITFSSMERDIVHIVKRRSIDVIFIDLFDRLNEISSATADKPHVIKRLLQREASLAKKYNVHFCNLVQIRRPDIKLKDVILKFKPSIDQLKESGAYEEIMDLILLLYRQGYYDDSIPDDQVEIIIGKQRMGPRNRSVMMDAYWERVTIEDKI